MDSDDDLLPEQPEEITIAVPAWIMESYELPSRELRGTVSRQTEKAVEFVGTMNTRRTERCLRCASNLDARERDSGYCTECMVTLKSSMADGKLPALTLWLPKLEITLIEGTGTQLEDKGPTTTSNVTITVRVNGSHIEAQADRFDVQAKAALKKVQGSRWVPGLKLWRYPASASTAAALMEAIEGYQTNLSERFRQLNDIAGSREAHAAYRDMSEADLAPIPHTNSDMPPWEHQLQAYHFGSRMDSFGLWAAMGVGKTRITIDVLNNSDVKKILILAPKSVVGVWPREFRKWGADLSKYLFVPLRPELGSVEYRTLYAQKFIEQGEAHGLSVVVIVNYEAAWRDPFDKWALAHMWDYVILDESHRAKGPNSKISQYVGRLGRRTRHRVALTGTPMPNNPLDVFGQYRFLDPGIFGTSFTTFRARYAVMGGYNNKQVTDFRVVPFRKDGSPNPLYDPRLAAEFNSKMFSISMEIGEEVLDLPELQEIDRTFDLSKKARKVYNEMEEEKYVDLVKEGVLDHISELLKKVDDGTATEAEMEEAKKYNDAGDTEASAKNVLTKMLRLQQITGGVMRDDAGYDHVVDKGKKEVLEDILEDIGPDEPVVVFCRFKHDLAVVAEAADKLKRRYAELSGSRRDAITEDSEMSPGVEVAGVQIQSGGVGIDLTKARYVIYYSLTHSLGEYEQSMKRVHRPGQTRNVIVYHLVALDTIDSDIYAAIEGKGRIVDFVLRGVRKRNAA